MRNLHEENAILKKKVKDLEMKLSQAEIDLMKKQTEKLEQIAEVIRLN